MMQIGDRIRMARDALDLTQRQLAEKLEVSAGAVAQWETDATKPNIKRRADLARILNIPFEELLPEAANAGEMTIRDPQILAVAHIMLQMPRRAREAFLMGVAAAHAAYTAQETPDPATDC